MIALESMKTFTPLSSITSSFGLSFLDEIVGQFAIAFINFKLKKLILIRDRIGQKPLFYSLGKSKILFSSNLKSISFVLRY